MSTENEEWRENSYNEENTGAGRDGNKSYNREGGERPYRPSYNREGGDRPYRPRFNPGPTRLLQKVLLKSLSKA